MAGQTKVIVLSTAGAGNWIVPGDWNNNSNRIHMIGGGGLSKAGLVAGIGGGGGAYTQITNFVAYSGSVIGYYVGYGGNSGTTNDNLRTTFNYGQYVAEGATTDGVTNAGGLASPVTGLVTASYAGGNGCINGAGSDVAGGGAAGPYGPGLNAVSGTSGGDPTSGAGDNGFGGAAVTGISNGLPGREITSGLGSGSGGSRSTSQGGLYGGGGGGSGNGAQGVIIIVYTTAGSGYFQDDSILGQIDLDDAYITDQWLIDKYVGNNLYAAGYNFYGNIGDGTAVSRSSPIQIGSLINWKQVGMWQISAGLKTDGTLWVWGLNTDGALGLGTISTLNVSSPVQLGLLSDWKQISVGYGPSAAIKTDGTLWSWGLNTWGNLGKGDIVSRSSPVQVGLVTDTNWKQVSCGAYHTVGIQNNGRLWAWGLNDNGQLGHGNLTRRSSPVLVGSLTTWKQVAGGGNFTAAIKTDGTLWTWGQNGNGQLGDGTINPKSSPIQVGLLTNWKQVEVAAYATYCIKTDGTLWSFGKNLYGGLGLGDTLDRSSPVQIGSLTNWKSLANIRGTDGSIAAIKTDGSLWVWGFNDQGQFGQGNIINYSSPVQVGLSTNWKQVSISATLLGVTSSELN